MARSQVTLSFLIVLSIKSSLSSRGYTTCPGHDLCFCSDSSDRIEIKCSNVTSIKPIQELLLSQFGDNRVNKLVISKPCALTTLPNNVFNTTISRFDSFCPLRDIEQHAFKRTKSLVSINIVDAPFDKIPPGITEFRTLKYLKILNGKFQYLKDELWKLPSLLQVHFMKGKLKRLSRDCFVRSPRINHINFSNNILEYIPPGTFDALKSLRRLSLNNNKLTTVDGLFENVNFNLKKLNLNSNELKSVNNVFLKNSCNITVLYIGRNSIGCLNRSFLQRFPLLEQLDIHRTECDQLDPDMLSASPWLKIINLSDNEIYSIPEDLFKKTRYLEKIYLQTNHITNVQEIFRGLSRLKYLILKNNKIYYMAKAFEDLHSLISLDLRNNSVPTIPRISFPRKMLLKRLLLTGNPLNCDCRLKWLNRWFMRTKHGSWKDNPRCFYPNELRGKYLKSLTMEDISSESLILDHCPEPCQCKCDSKRIYYYLNLDCSNKNLSNIPAFWTRYLGALDLSGNGLTDTAGIRSMHRKGLQSLNLERNEISNIDIDLPIMLKKLRLSGNMLNRLPPVLTKNNSIELVTLSNNPWICDCDARDLRDWLISKGSTVADINETTCGYTGPRPQLYGKVIVFLKESDLCPSRVKLIVSITMGILGCLLVMTSLIIVHSRYHIHIKVYLYAHGITWMKEEDTEEDKIFDGFLSYCSEDENFAVDIIAKELELMEPKFELCIPDRDILLGESVLLSFLQAAELSKKIIIILSRNYVDNEFCIAVFREAFQLSLEDKVCRMILIKTEDLPTNAELDPDLKLALESKACLSFGERLFWEKLRFAMPKKVNKKIPQNSEAMCQHNAEDDSDLIGLLT